MTPDRSAHSRNTFEGGKCGRDSAGQVRECRKIAAELEKFGIHLKAAEIPIEKGYYVPTSRRRKGILFLNYVS